jgi:uncharacterized membrane protein
MARRRGRKFPRKMRVPSPRMEPKRSKYDTNPLDKDVADRATDEFGSSRSGSETGAVGDRTTRNVRGAAPEPKRADQESEAPTRRMDEGLASSYPSVFIKPPPQAHTAYEPPRAAPANIYQPPPGPPPGIYQPPPVPVGSQSRPVSGLGIAEKWANLLPYIPGHIGAVAAVIELLLVPRHETRARFHAAQGLALQLGILLVSAALGVVTTITDSSLGSGLFRAAATVFLIISMVRVYQGKDHQIAPLDDATRWLDEKIKPRK